MYVGSEMVIRWIIGSQKKMLDSNWKQVSILMTGSRGRKESAGLKREGLDRRVHMPATNLDQAVAVYLPNIVDDHM